MNCKKYKTRWFVKKKKRFINIAGGGGNIQETLIFRIVSIPPLNVYKYSTDIGCLSFNFRIYIYENLYIKVNSDFCFFGDVKWLRRSCVAGRSRSWRVFGPHMARMKYRRWDMFLIYTSAFRNTSLPLQCFKMKGNRDFVIAVSNTQKVSCACERVWVTTGVR